MGWIVNDGRIKRIWEAFAGRFVIIINIILINIIIIFNAKGVFIINLINILIVLITMVTAVRLEININEVMMVS